jgi:hypothetical protein
MDSLKNTGTPLVMTDAETNGEVQISCECGTAIANICLATAGENIIDFTLSKEDFDNYIEFLNFNQTRLAVTFRQADGQYIGLSKRRENSVTEMTFEVEGKICSISLEQASVDDLIDYVSAAHSRLAEGQ